MSKDKWSKFIKMNITHTLDFGTIGVGQKIITKSIKVSKPILEVTTSCGCTSKRIKDNELSFSYTGEKIPRQLFNRPLRVTKFFRIIYKDGSEERGQIVGTVIRN